MTSERKRAAQRANARKPRGKWANTDERRAIEEAKSAGRNALPEIVQMLLKIVRGELVDVEPSDRINAAKQIMDRCGMPAMSEAHLSGEAARFSITVSGVEGALGWPGAVGGSGGAGDGPPRDE